MKEISLRVDELQTICAKNKIIGQGSYGIVYKLDDDTLFKFNYKDFIDCFDVKGNKFDTRCLGDISSEIKDKKEIERIVYKGKERYDIQAIRKATNKQSQIKLTTLTQGLVFCDNYCVGYLLHNHKNMVNLYDFVLKVGLKDLDAQKVSDGINNAVTELMQNNIYHYDFTTRNILINPETNDIQIIDFEDQLRVYDAPDENSIKKMKQQIKAIEEFLLEHVNETGLIK